jgi:hypothetical protein
MRWIERCHSSLGVNRSVVCWFFGVRGWSSATDMTGFAAHLAGRVILAWINFPFFISFSFVPENPEAWEYSKPPAAKLRVGRNCSKGQPAHGDQLAESSLFSRSNL